MGEAMMRCFSYEEWWSPAHAPAGPLVVCCWCPAADASSLTPGAPTSSPHCTSACFGSFCTFLPWEAPISSPWPGCMRAETFLQDIWGSPLDTSPNCCPCFLCRMSPSEITKCLLLSHSSGSPPLLFEGHFELTLPSPWELRDCDWGHGRCLWRDGECGMLLKPRSAWSPLSPPVSLGVGRHQLKAAEAEVLTMGFSNPGTDHTAFVWAGPAAQKPFYHLPQHPQKSLATLSSPEQHWMCHFQHNPSQNWYKTSFQCENMQKCPLREKWRNLSFNWDSCGHKVLWPWSWPCCAPVPALVFLPRLTLKGIGWFHPNMKGARCSSWSPCKNREPWGKY